MNNIRLKSSIDGRQISERLKYNPEIMELQLFEEDLDRIEMVKRVIRSLKQRGIRVYLHHPMKHGSVFMDILSRDQEMYEFYLWSCRILAEICREERIHCVVHAHYSDSESSQRNQWSLRKEMKRRIEQIQLYAGGYFLWENTTHGIFSEQNPFLYEELVQPLKLPLCYDISHAFIALRGDNEKLKQALKKAFPYVAYYHVVDSMGVSHDSLPLGQGKIDWRMVKPFLAGKDYIFEIGLEDYLDCTPMRQSGEFLTNLDLFPIPSQSG